MLLQPSFELLSSPAFWKVCTKDRDRLPERASAEQPGIVVPRLMAVRSVDPTAEPISQMTKRKGISNVQLDLEVWLSPVGSEGTLADDESHNVSDVEFSHARR